MDRGREVRFRATTEEWKSISAYVHSKRKWKRVSDFARYAVFTQMDASKAGSHRKTRGEGLAPQQGGDSEGVRDS